MTKAKGRHKVRHSLSVVLLLKKAKVQVVADKTIAKLETYVAESKRNKREIYQEEDEVSDAALAQWWLDFGITRSVTKRTRMTFPYGSKQRGFSDQIINGR